MTEDNTPEYLMTVHAELDENRNGILRVKFDGLDRLIPTAKLTVLNHMTEWVEQHRQKLLEDHPEAALHDHNKPPTEN